MNQTDNRFEAQRITTIMDWPDVVFNHMIAEQASRLIEQQSFRALFLGPPGTGKTLMATLIGKSSGRDVYLVDLSMVVSKYIGDTEKNLSLIFDAAQTKNGILLFDEADSLFGKRTLSTEGNNITADQQIDFLLKEIQRYEGAVILASNLCANTDKVFTGSFDIMIRFGIPTAEERYRLWLNSFSGQFSFSPEIDMHKIAEKYELTGGAIVNILRFCALEATCKKESCVTQGNTNLRNTKGIQKGKDAYALGRFVMCNNL
ncbi:ATP-binding protein [Mucilaginibacter glaciei]|uniref:ATP-binding protein n=1 Tax=Mucilaginibacter glaciei TaxID=2772109 RepID=A0A926S321_9SPHI|nr:ATP-binding protein [Mucilaginibacter glaciei]MBD1393759.1 ATP-binding protein [Mucilaginibacter glaciei]